MTAMRHKRQPQLTPPDGGYGWVVVFSCMCTFFVSAACFSSFGVLYLEYAEAFGQSMARVGLLVSTSSIVTHVSGIVVTTLLSGVDPRLLCSCAGLLTSLCILSAAFASSFTQLIIAYGLSGCGNGVLYVMNSAILLTYFDKKRTLATGLTTVGMSISNVVIPPFTQMLIDLYTWRGALIIIAGLLLQSVWLSILLRPLKPAKPKRVSRQNTALTPNKDKSQFSQEIIYKKISKTDPDEGSDKNESICSQASSLFLEKMNFRILCNVKFLIYGLGTLLFFTGYNMFYLHMINRGLDAGLTKYQATLIPALSGFVNMIWRPTFGLITTLFQMKNILIVGLASILFGVFIAVFGAVSHLSLFLVLAACAGLSVASQVITYHPALVDILGIENVLGAVGLLGLFVGTGQMLGTPLAGWIYDTTQNYSIPFFVAGAIEVTAGLFYLSLVCAKKHEVPQEPVDTKDTPAVEHLKKRMRMDSYNSSIIGSTLSLGGI